MRAAGILKICTVALVFGFIFLPACTARSDDNKNCTSIRNQELVEMLAKINIKDAPILYVKESALPGFCEIAIERGNQPAIFYINKAKTHLLLGSILDAKTMTNLTAQAAQAIRDKKKVDASKISLDNALFLGDPKAAKKVIIFTDPDCPYCSDLHHVISRIAAVRKDIVFFIKLYPLEMHKDAYWKSKSIVCSKSMQLLEDCFAKKEIAKNDCPTDEVDNTIKAAKSLGINGTPAIILPDGRLRIGTMSQEELTALIDEKP